MSSQAPKYRFRVLDIPTLVSQLVEIGINVTAADLEAPQPAIVSFFKKILKHHHNNIDKLVCTIFVP